MVCTRQINTIAIVITINDNNNNIFSFFTFQTLVIQSVLQ